MKDGALKACMGMACVTAVYGIYMVSNAIAGNEIPDGLILTGVVGAVCGLAGYSVAVAQATETARTRTNGR
jgi:hypothetical protein